MRKFLLTVLVAFGALSAAAAGYNCLTVNLNDGSKVDIVMTDDLKVSFTENQLVAKGARADVAVDKADIYFFEHVNDPAASISDITADGGSMTREGNSLSFSNLPEGSVVAVYDIKGVQLSSETVSGEFTLSLDGLSAGVYVVTVNKLSYKVNVR